MTQEVWGEDEEAAGLRAAGVANAGRSRAGGHGRCVRRRGTEGHDAKAMERRGRSRAESERHRVGALRRGGRGKRGATARVSAFLEKGLTKNL